MIIRTHEPGKMQNLYDQKTHRTLQGVLYFSKQEQSKLNQQVEEIELQSIEKEEENQIENYPDVTADQFMDRFLQFAFTVDTFVFSGLRRIKSGFFRSYQWLSGFVSVLDIAIEVEKNKLKVKQIFKSNLVLKEVKKPTLAVKVSKIRRVKPKVVRPVEQIAANELPRIGFPKISFASLRLPIAALCLLFAFVSVGALTFPLISAQVYSMIPASSKPTPSPTPFRYNSYYQAENNPLYPINEFRLVVPKIGLESNVVDNVDPTIEGEYKDKLQYGVAHAKGSYLPPERGGPVYLFAHSTDTIFNIARFNAKFFSVRELEPGDEIKVYFNGAEYKYLVRQKFIINPEEVDVIKNATSTDLILQTCWPPGTDWQRLIVYADRV